VRKSKEEHKNNLIKKLINENSSGLNWWKTAKQLTGIKSRGHGKIRTRNLESGIRPRT
jgi:hypothetical protein